MGYANLTHDLSPKFASTSQDGGGGWGTGVRDRRRRALSPYKLYAPQTKILDRRKIVG